MLAFVSISMYTLLESSIGNTDKLHTFALLSVGFYKVIEYDMGRNRKREYVKRVADNHFTKITGAEFTKLSGASECWICHQTQWGSIPIRKVAFALFNDWQKFEVVRMGQRMRHLRVKQSCGVDQCVNPDHLVGTEKPVDIAAGFRT